MKYGRSLLFTSLFALATLVACGKSDSSSTAVVPPGSIPGCVGTGCVTSGGVSYAVPFTSGDTETLNTNYSALKTYAGVPLNSPGPVQVNISLLPNTVNSTTVYLGQMQIRYQDGSILHNGVFGNGDVNSHYRMYANDVSKQTSPGVYRIFFEDAAGALIVVIKGVAGTDTATSATGTIYFYNFNSTAPNPLYSGAFDQYGTYFPGGGAYCWMIDLGPYDCRNFNVPPTTSYYDNSDSQVPGFQTLGTISTINIHTALGI